VVEAQFGAAVTSDVRRLQQKQEEQQQQAMLPTQELPSSSSSAAGGDDSARYAGRPGRYGFTAAQPPAQGDGGGTGMAEKEQDTLLREYEAFKQARALTVLESIGDDPNCDVTCIRSILSTLQFVVERSLFCAVQYMPGHPSTVPYPYPYPYAYIHTHWIAGVCQRSGCTSNCAGRSSKPRHQ
jgi:hypothetical protein